LEKNYSPTFYGKVRYNPKSKQFYTQFFEGKIRRGEEKRLVPQEIEGKRCDVVAAVCFDGIFVSNSCVSLQVKVDQVSMTFRTEENTEQIVSTEVEEDEHDDGVEEGEW